MFNKIKKLAKKAREALKHVVEKAEEYVMAKEEIELKKMKLVVDTVKCAAKGAAGTVKSVIKGAYEHHVAVAFIIVGLGVGLGVGVTIEKKYN